MTTPAENAAPGPVRALIILVFRRCDRADDDAATAAGRDAAREHAARDGRHVIGEFIVHVCPFAHRDASHAAHRATAEARLESVIELGVLDSGYTVLLAPREFDVLPDSGWLMLLRDLLDRKLLLLVDPAEARATPGAGWRDILVVLGRSDRFSRPRRLSNEEPLARERADSYSEHMLPMLSQRAIRQPSSPSTFGGAPPPATAVPGRVGPLPHDGLFIRRNNAFGTRSTLGIAELIDQGVLIDQTQIRFDDFIAAKPDHIPAPGPDAAVAVSHGVAAVSGRFKTHDETTHLVEIALRAGAGSAAGPGTGEPLPVNFIFAVDISSSMAGEKLDDAMVAIRELYGKLRDFDVLGIIVFHHEASTVLRATRKADIDPGEFAGLVGSLRATGGTDLNLGLSFALNEIERFATPGTINCVYLFSDGDPTSGERNWITIRANVAARLRGSITLSCFGFGSDARIPELRALAGISGGHWTFVTQADDVSFTLSDDLARRDSLAAINIQLRIDIPADTQVWHIYGHDLITDPTGRSAVHAEARAAAERTAREYGVAALPDLIRDEHGIRIFAPDLAFGETYWVVLELQAPAEAAGPPFGTATVQYLDTVRRDNSSFELDLSAAGAIPAETVLTHGIGLWTSEVTFYALDDLYDNDRESAKKRLTQHGMQLAAAYAELPAEQFRDDRVTLAKLASLADNLGTVRTWSDTHGNGPFGYAVFAMNEFGRVRNGFLTQRAPRA